MAWRLGIGTTCTLFAPLILFVLTSLVRSTARSPHFHLPLAIRWHGNECIPWKVQRCVPSQSNSAWCCDQSARVGRSKVRHRHQPPIIPGSFPAAVIATTLGVVAAHVETSLNRHAWALHLLKKGGTGFGRRPTRFGYPKINGPIIRCCRSNSALPACRNIASVRAP
jgi:hypothetical protein